MTATQEWLSHFKTLEYTNYGYEEGKPMSLKIMEPEYSLWRGIWLPVKVVKEYPKWILFEVMPHTNMNHSLGTSHPYRLGVSKVGLILGEYKLKEGIGYDCHIPKQEKQS